MNGSITMTPEHVAAIMKVCEASNVSSIITYLSDAEESLKQTAYEHDELVWFFRTARSLELIRRQFEELEKTLGYEPERE